MTRAISRHLLGPATWLWLVLGCGSRQQATAPTPTHQPTPARVLPLPRVIVLETAGPPPADTLVSFTAGTPRVIVLRHGPPENIVFARVSFSAGAFADSGQTVSVEVRPRPGVYGLELSTSLPPTRDGTSVEFDYARYFSAPARAQQVYRSTLAFERGLAVGRVLPENQIELLPSINQEADRVTAAIPGSGTYLVAAPQ
jgi:hypothetical protein